VFGISEKFTFCCLKMFNHDDQIDILQEECAELIKACSKVKRGKPEALANLKEELAHVAMSSAMIANIYGITTEDINVETRKKADKYVFKYNEEELN